LNQSVTTWNESETKIIELKYKSPQIGRLPNLETWGKALMVKIHVITGWVLPSPDMIGIFIDQFSKKLIEDYPHLNVDEIEFAFRSIGTGVKDWGKSMNLSLVDEVLKEYSAQRFEASQQEERQKDKPVQKIYTAEELDNIQRADVEAFYQRCLRGVLPPSELPEYFHTILVKDGLISSESNDLHAFFAYYINNGYKNIYLKG
jgi:hypothetical protein